MGLMNSIVSIGTVTLQYAINGFGLSSLALKLRQDGLCPLLFSL